MCFARLDAFARGQIVGLHQAGMAQEKIARIVEFLPRLTRLTVRCVEFLARLTRLTLSF